MHERNLEHLGAAAGLTASVAVGVPVLLDQLIGADSFITGPGWVWWSAYLGHLLAFLLMNSSRRPAWLSEHRLLAVLTVLGGTAYAFTPQFGWTAVLLVVTAATGAYVLSPRGAAALVVGQSVLIAAVVLRLGQAPLDAFLSLLVYGSFQSFGVLVIWSQRREAEARARLDEVNAALRAATVLLADSSRATERLRIARELHDLVGHQLTALALELEVAAQRSTPPASEHVTRARRIAKDLLTDVRAAVGELRAPTPDLGLAFATIAADLPRPQIHLDVPEDLELDDERTLALIRCVQEIVTNTMRHADADNLWIALRSTADGETVLDAHDDGRGASSLSPGNGLIGMRERIEQLGGAVRFEGDHGGGFHVQAEVPAR